MTLGTNLTKLHSYMKDVLSDVPEDTILIILLAKLSQIAMLHRISVKAFEYSKDTLVNVYALNIMKSGGGKDQTISEINSLLLPPYFRKRSSMEELYRKDVQKRLMKEAEENEALTTPNMQEKYVAKNMPRDLIDTFQDSTLEGFLATRAEFEKAKYGGTLVMISEFSDYILNDSPAREQFLTIVKEVYEEGNNLAKVIKAEKTAKGVEGVPNSILFQTSPDGLFDGTGAYRTLAFLNRGVARRSLICLPEVRTTTKELSFKEHKEKLIKIQARKEEMQLIIEAMTAVTYYDNSSTFIFDDVADERLYTYKLQTKKIKSDVEALEAEAKSRPRKAAKIAGLLAFIEHPNEKIVTLEDFENAISIVEHYSQYSHKLIGSINQDKVLVLYNYLKMHLNITFSKTDLRGLKIVPWNTFNTWLKEAMIEIDTLAQLDRYQLVVSKVGKNGINYKLMSPTDIAKEQIAKFTKHIKNETKSN